LAKCGKKFILTAATLARVKLTSAFGEVQIVGETGRLVSPTPADPPIFPARRAAVPASFLSFPQSFCESRPDFCHSRPFFTAPAGISASPAIFLPLPPSFCESRRHESRSRQAIYAKTPRFRPFPQQTATIN